MTVAEARTEYQTAKDRRDTRRIHHAARALRDARTAALRQELSSPRSKPKSWVEKVWGFLSWG